MTDKEHAEMLAEFFTTLFRPDERVWIFPGLKVRKDAELVEKAKSLPEEVAGKTTKYLTINPPKGIECDEPIWVAKRFLDPFQRKASSTDTRVLPKLRRLSELGYNIFFAINPLSDSRRCQKTVREAAHILLECDDKKVSIEQQMEILQQYQDSFASITFSGGKSLHALLHFTPTMKNWRCVNWKEARYLEKGETSFEWDQYRKIAHHWIDKLAQDGLKVDTAAAVDCSRVSRVPGFPHSETGKLSDVRFLNPNAGFNYNHFFSDLDWEENYRSMIEGEELKRTTISMSNEAVSKPDSIDQLDTLDNIDNIVIDHTSSQLSLSNKDISLEVSPVVVKPESITAKTNVMHMEGRRESFLDDLSKYERLKKEGIPFRHIRRKLHPVVFKAARILGMPKEEMAAEWLRIVSMNPENIGCSPEEAVEDLIRAYEKGRRCGIYLPDCSILPDLDPIRLKTLSNKLKDEGCRYVHGVCKIIEKVLWNSVRSLPRQCVTGKLGIRATELQAVCRLYTKPFGWMMDKYLVVLTDDLYISGMKTRQYKVNIPLLLHWLGFSTDELNWEKAAKCCPWEGIAA